MSTPVTALINPQAKGGLPAQFVAKLESQLRACFPAIAIHCWDQEESLRAWASRLASGKKLVIVAGGDGTIRCIASALMCLNEPETALAVLPIGTGNDFARELGVTSLSHALNVATGESSIRRDVIEIRNSDDPLLPCEHALLFVAAGSIVQAVSLTTSGLKKHLGNLWAYRVGILRALPRLKLRTLDYLDDEEHEVIDSLGLAIGLVEKVGGNTLRLFPPQCLDAEKLAVMRLRDLSSWELIQQLARLGAGKHLNHPKVCYTHTTRVQLTGGSDFQLQADGDVIGCLPAEIRIKKGALLVKAPE